MCRTFKRFEHDHFFDAFPGDFQAMTLAEINSLAHDILPRKKAVVFTALPK